MKIFLDANYIIYLKYSESDEIFRLLRKPAEELKDYELLVNIAVINEVVWILRRKYNIELNEIFEFLDRFLDFVNVVSLEAEDYELMKEFIAQIWYKTVGRPTYCKYEEEQSEVHSFRGFRV